MQLKYRGTIYLNRNSSVQATSKENCGVYRGVPWHKRPFNQQIVPIGIAKLKYRGVDYLRIKKDFIGQPKNLH